jgi:uncharacterized damage-inducible protein DinB
VRRKPILWCAVHYPSPETSVKRIGTLSVAAVFVPVLLNGQQQQRPTTPPPGTNATVMSFKFFAAHFGDWLVAAFDSIPSSKYAYRPTPPQQSVGYIAQHLEDANYGLCNRLGATKHVVRAKDSLPDTVKATWPKDTLVARLRASLAFCDSSLARLSDSDLHERVPYGPPSSGFTALSARSMLAFVTDLAEHYSQIATYMRLIALVPPSALPSKQRTAVDLPAGVLSHFVGKYDLPPSVLQDAPAFLLDVTLKDGGLYLKAGSRAVRLWPETPTDFFVKEVDAQIIFTTDGSGAVTGLLLRQNGESRLAKKVE